MALRNTTGVVLNEQNLGETDRLVTFYCLNEGLLRLAAPNAARPGKGKAGLLQKFCWNDIEYYQPEKREKLGSINSLSSRRSFQVLREDLTRLSYGSYILEFYKKTGIEAGDEGLFSHLITTLEHLSENDELQSYKSILLIFKARSLALLGFAPNLFKCLNCNEDIGADSFNSQDRIVFSLKQGGVFCCQESAPSRGLFPFDSKCYIALRDFVYTGYNKLSLHEKKLDKDRIDYIDNIIDKFINYHLDININSCRFIGMFGDE